MSPTTGTWKGRGWAKRWMERRSQLERRQEAGEWINCDANCHCCRYQVDEGCVDTDEDANENCPAPGPTPVAAPAPTAESTNMPPSSETLPATTSDSGSASTTPISTTASSSTPTTSTSGPAASSPSPSQEWVFPAATGNIRARQAADAATFGPVYREDSMIVQWTPEDTTPGIQWFCESNAGNRSGGLISSNQSQPLQIQFNSLADQADGTDDVYCRLGFTDSPSQTVQWQYINTPDVNGANMISAPANVATAAVATVTSLISSATTTISASATSSSENDSGSSGLSTGAAAGIGVGVGIAVIVFIILGVCFWRRRKTKGAYSTSAWAAGDKKSQTSDDSNHPSYYSDQQQNLVDGVYELPGAPVHPTELPAGIKGTAAMPSELHSYEKKGILAELGSDKDLEEQNIRPRPLAPHPASLVNGGDDATMLSPSEYGTVRSAVSPASGPLNSEGSGNVSPLWKQSHNSPVSAESTDTEPGWAAGRSRFPRKPVGRN